MLAKDLRAAGKNLWLDQLDIQPGDAWDRSVEEALKTSPELLAVLSPASVASANVMDEVSFALEERKRVVPILYRKCDIPFRLKRLQYIDFTADYQLGFEALLRVLVPTADREVETERLARERAQIERTMPLPGQPLPTKPSRGQHVLRSPAALGIAATVVVTCLALVGIRMRGGVGHTPSPQASMNSSRSGRRPSPQAEAPNVEGKWKTQVLTNPYDKNQHSILLLEFIQQGGTLSGTITEMGVDATNSFTRVILDGKIKDNKLSFYTRGEVTEDEGTRPYKEYYFGIMNDRKDELTFKRLNDVSSGGVPETFVAKRN